MFVSQHGSDSTLLTVVIDHQDATALDEPRCPYRDESTFSQRRSAHDMKPARGESAIYCELLRDLQIFRSRKCMGAIARVIVQSQQDRFGFVKTALPDEPASCDTSC
jgi:hypothetical protein